MLKNLDCLKPTPNNLFYPPAKNDYVYFEGAPFQSDPNFRFANASWAADAAMLAYARYQKIRMNEADLNGILGPHFTTTATIGDCFVDNASTGRGFFAATDTFAILALRGTEKGNNHDAKADLKLVLVPEEALGVGKVHWGFQDYLDSVWQRVKQLVDQYRSTHKTQEICITGHSLGAAMATLAFHRLQDDHTSLYTFGCPRVGNQDFCQSLEKMTPDRAFRFVDFEDVVTQIPLTEWFAGYQHPKCTTFLIDQQHAIQKDPTNLPDVPKVGKALLLDFLEGSLDGTVLNSIPEPLADHSPVRYCHWISKAIKSA